MLVIVVMLLPAGLAAHMEAGASCGLSKKMLPIGEVEKPETLYANVQRTVS